MATLSEQTLFSPESFEGLFEVGRKWSACRVVSSKERELNAQGVEQLARRVFD